MKKVFSIFATIAFVTAIIFSAGAVSDKKVAETVPGLPTPPTPPVTMTV